MTYLKPIACLLALSGMTLAYPAVARAPSASSTLKAADTDNDGTIDLNEAKAAAAAHFKAADKDNDGTVDASEVGKAVVKADTDNDGTVDAAEYDKAVEKSFKKADSDNDGTVDAKELASPAGKRLAVLIGGKR
jgi:Ca2+-binding EF-hand superfamily protein